jgi:hypothetical protein
MQTRLITSWLWPSLARSPVQSYQSIFGRINVGAVLGQAAYELAFLKLGPLFILGLVFVAVIT